MTTENSTEERIRKIFIKDLKSNEVVHTVFKAHTKTSAKARSGKAYLSLLLVDKTGQLDGRVFENAEAADAAFVAGDYLLLKGKVGQFHGKPQLVVERLERLDPEPIDAADFAYTPVVEAPKAAAPRADDATPVAKVKTDEKRDPSFKATRARLLKLLDVPEVVQALDVLLRHLEGGAEAPVKKVRGPRVEHKAAVAEGKHERHARHEKPELKRDPGLPEGIAFKPFGALMPTDAAGSTENGADGAKPGHE